MIDKLRQYKTALARIESVTLYDTYDKNNIVDYNNHSHVGIKYHKEIDLLNELISLYTPRKPVDGCCPNCGCKSLAIHFKDDGKLCGLTFNYCDACGQSIDWADGYDDAWAGND